MMGQRTKRTSQRRRPGLSMRAKHFATDIYQSKVAAMTMLACERTPRAMFLSERMVVPNDRCERWGPAATDARIVADVNGWPPSAPHLG
jgi:hypothetical protein